MSAEEKKFLSGCGCYMRFEQKVIHSLDELRKSRPCPISERVCTFSLGLFNSPLRTYTNIFQFFNQLMTADDLKRKKGLLKKSHSNVASAFRHWLQKIRKKRLQPVEVAAVL